VIDAAMVMALPARSEMERAYLERDGAFDGIFFTAVRTTKIFCRPTCPARKPLAKNVEFFQTAAAAVGAGYRACKRCRPLEPANHPAWATALLREIEHCPNQRIKDADLKARGIDPTTVRRFFEQHYQMSFHAFVRTRRVAVACQRLGAGIDLDTVIGESGFESHSGFRAAFMRIYGYPPGRVCL
jgi:AraC family transcriptional regulator, regulatory protein of adaptative response / methylated-DNA-[protein]-cysteine methyltransferase